jgi:hypothetical protein
MTKRTNTIFVVSILYALVLAFGLAAMLYVVHMQGSKLEEAKITIADHIAKEAVYSNVVRLLESSKADRALLATYFISEKDTISFISELEQAAEKVGVTLRTTELSVVSATTKDGVATPAVLSVGVQFSGEEMAVKKFISLVENVPYHKKIPNFNISRDTASDNWTADTKLQITMTP